MRDGGFTIEDWAIIAFALIALVVLMSLWANVGPFGLW
jgi:hypothetical protein